MKKKELIRLCTRLLCIASRRILGCGLKWGNQMFLRCSKVQSNGEISPLHRRSSVSIRSNEEDSGEGIGAVREKLMFELLKETDKMKHAEGLEELPEKQVSPARLPVPVAVSNAVDLSRPWNLRTRRAACKDPKGFVARARAGGGGSVIDVNKTNGLTPLRTENKSPRLRIGAGGSSSGEQREREGEAFRCLFTE